MKIYGVELIELDCNTFKNGVHLTKGGPKRFKERGRVYKHVKQILIQQHGKEAFTLPHVQTISNFIY